MIGARTSTLPVGAFAGLTAMSWLDPYVGTHVLVSGPRFAAHICGSLTRAEAMSIAESLRS